MVNYCLAPALSDDKNMNNSHLSVTKDSVIVSSISFHAITKPKVEELIKTSHINIKVHNVKTFLCSKFSDDILSGMLNNSLRKSGLIDRFEKLIIDKLKFENVKILISIDVYIIWCNIYVDLFVECLKILRQLFCRQVYSGFDISDNYLYSSKEPITMEQNDLSKINIISLKTDAAVCCAIDLETNDNYMHFSWKK